MYENDLRSWIKHLDFMLLDILSITISFWAAFGVRKSMSGIAWESNYRGLYLIFIALHIILVFFFRSYSNIIRRKYTEEILKIIQHNVIMLSCIFAYLVFTKQSILYSRLFLGYYVSFNFSLMCLARCGWKHIIRKKLSADDKLPYVLLITNRDLASECMKKLKNIEYQAFRISGIILLDGNEQESDIDGVPVVGNQTNMLEYIRLNVVDQVVLQTGGVSEAVRKLVQTLVSMGVVVHISLEQFEQLPHKHMNQMGGLSVITTYFQSARMLELFIKRGIDIVGSLVGLFITGITFVFVAPIIYVKSPGSVFFSQERVGKNGRKFRIYKFRSMYLDAEERKKDLLKDNEMQGFMFKMENDPRIIAGIGNFIRNTSIDELPQFWNVLKGDMSLVGTRPPTVDEFEMYSYHHKVRLSFRPGLTGMWQVSGRNEITDFERVVELDEEYIENWNIWLDIKILFKTVKVVLQRKGSK